MALAAMLVMAIFIAKKSGYNNDLGNFFPHRSLVGNMYQLIADSNFSDQAQLEIDTGEPGGALMALPEVQKLVKLLQEMPEVEEVDFQIKGGTEASWEELARVLPLLTESSILATADLAQATRRARQAMMLPGMPVQMLQLDPFGWSGKHLQELQSFQRLSGMNLSLQHSFPTDIDVRRLLLNLQVAVPASVNAEQINRLRQAILSLASSTLPDAKVSFFSPLVHAEENETTVRRDIFRISLASMLGLLLLFFFVYGRSWDAVWIPVLPFASSLLATGLLALLFGNICLLILGICGSIAGLAVDQGIHVYTAFAGKRRLDKLSALFIPLVMSALTSAIVFFLLGFSGITAYQQLGFFAGCALLINLTLSFFLLPTLLRRRPQLHFAFTNFSPRPGLAWAVSGAWLLLCLGAVVTLPKAKFNFDLAALDGASSETLRAERDFQDRWRHPEAGSMIVVTGENQEIIQQTCEKLGADFFAPGTYFHVASLWPSQARRAANLRTWQSAEVLSRLESMAAILSQECQQAGLPASFHAPFLQALRAGIDSGLTCSEPRLFQIVSERLLRRHQQSLAGLFFFKASFSDQEHLSLLRSLDRLGNCALLSGASFRLAAIADLIPLMRKVLFLAIGAVLALLLPVYRSPLKLLLIFLPGFTATLVYVSLMSLSGAAINLAGCFGMIILIGLVIDYGIFALHHGTTGGATGGATTVSTSIFLSAVTTLFTSGALLFSRHPVLFHTGLVLSVEILLTMLTALYVIPSLIVVFRRHRRTALSLLMLGCALLLASGCRSVPSVSPASATLTAVEAHQQWHAWQQTAQQSSGTQLLSLKIDIWWYSFAMLLAVRHDSHDQQLTATGMSPSGAQLFTVSGKNGQEHHHSVAPIFPAIAHRKIFSSLYFDLSNIFFHFTDGISFPALVHLPYRHRSSSGESHFFSGFPLQLTQKKLGSFPNRQWIVYYGQWDQEQQSYSEIVYKNYRTGCTFTLRPMTTNNKEKI